MPGKKPIQLELFRWGGRRAGAGRKRAAERPLVPHRGREIVAPRLPVLVTIRMKVGLPSLRVAPIPAVLFDAIRRSNRAGRFTIVHATIQSNHLHLICEARDRVALSRGLQGFGVRIAVALQEIFDVRGPIRADRPHVRILRSPTEVRNALRYVLNNSRRHGIHYASIDGCSSGPWFDGWIERPESSLHPSPFAAATSWLLTSGWRRLGLLDPREIPARPRERARRAS